METAPRLYHVPNQAVDRSTGVDVYFETLRREQARFLETIGRARSLLDGGSGHLAEFSASQAVLTRQFLDAQRAILKRRAEILAESSIDARPDPRTMAAQAQLAALLDDWWRTENKGARSAIDTVGATETVVPCRGVAPPRQLVNGQVGTGRQPSDVLAALEDVDPAHLLTLLTSLADSLAPPPEKIPRPQVAPVDELVIRLDHPPTGSTSDDTFREFWHERTHDNLDRAEPQRLTLVRRAAASLAGRVLVPMTVVTSAVVLLMAWIG